MFSHGGKPTLHRCSQFQLLLHTVSTQLASSLIHSFVHSLTHSSGLKRHDASFVSVAIRELYSPFAGCGAAAAWLNHKATIELCALQLLELNGVKYILPRRFRQIPATGELLRLANRVDIESVVVFFAFVFLRFFFAEFGNFRFA